MQVQTNSTVPVQDALDAIDGEPKALKFTNGDDTYYVRSAAEKDHRFGYLLSIHVDVIDDRRTVTVEKERTIRDAIEAADTAEIIQINDSPWSPLHDE